MSRKAAHQIINRQRLIIRPPIPDSMRDLGTMLQDWTVSRNIYKGQFTADDGSIGIVFYDDDMLQHFNLATELHIDGTFKCVPRSPRACQLLLIHIRRADIGFPVIFVLCERRTASFYKAMWDFIKIKAPGLVDHLNVINSDYERAILSASRSAFGERIHIRGCWFHFIQAVTKKWKKLRLPRNEDGNSVLQKAWAIALLPAENFAEAIQIISDSARQLQLDRAKINSFIAYLKGFWLRQANIVSVYGSAVRTNNISEACHRHLVRRLGGIHPPLSTFIPLLVKYMKKISIDWQELNAGIIHNRRRQDVQRPRDRHISHQQELLLSNRISILDFLTISVPRTEREELDVDLNLQEVRRQPRVRRARQEIAAIPGPPRRRGRPRRGIPVPPLEQLPQPLQQEQEPREERPVNQQLPQLPEDQLEHVGDAVLEREQPGRDIEEDDAPPQIDPNSCKICLNAPANIVYLPCAHLCACLSCSQTVQRTHENRVEEALLNGEEYPQFLRCPLCRGHVQNTVQVYT
ncbi:uncharacterized protein [Venturia canescens]|uniref:uncharacterized protein n=1 Tax=Venturia canescens TaxID=32260 RepID=UPI001C9CAE45|nr:uncharacterized protein LOC122409468 [Venturia canescens]